MSNDNTNDIDNENIKFTYSDDKVEFADGAILSRFKSIVSPIVSAFSSIFNASEHAKIVSDDGGEEHVFVDNIDLFNEDHISSFKDFVSPIMLAFSSELNLNERVSVVSDNGDEEYTPNNEEFIDLMVNMCISACREALENKLSQNEDLE